MIETPRQAAARLPREWQDHFGERAGICEHDGQLTREEAEKQALADTLLAMNKHKDRISEH